MQSYIFLYLTILAKHSFGFSMWKEAFLKVSHFSHVEKAEKCGLDVKTLCGGLDLS